MNFNATTMALNLLKSRNPMMAQAVERMMARGADPKQILLQGINNGSITQQQLQQVKMLCQQFGMSTTDLDSILKK